jgi:hypothetical protein
MWGAQPNDTLHSTPPSRRLAHGTGSTAPVEQSVLEKVQDLLLAAS